MRVPRLFDVIVIGAGHAGCEAATASARAEVSTLLLTHSKQTIGAMSCNPSFGGIGKGQLMREVDALDGVSARIADKSGITFQALNRSHGPAVIGLRAQIDRKLYKKLMQEELLDKTKNLEVCEASVEDLVIEEGATGGKRLKGVVLGNGEMIEAKSVVIATGTFLDAEIFRGSERIRAGRIGEKSATGLALALKRLNLRLGRLRTGTPPRLLRSSIALSSFTRMPPDSSPIPFSFLSTKDDILPVEQQLPTYLGSTNERVAQIVNENLHLNEHIREETNGPRYCPSLEAKVIRFPHLHHRLFLEHEGLDCDVMYPQGMSMTFDLETQRNIFRAIPGMERVEIVQQGYGVQYDYVDPKQLKGTLEVKEVEGLFLTGQINGTTGYEEAAAQGVIGGMNAAARAKGKEGEEISRVDGMIGVLIDDLSTLGTNEPYRMFSSRAEFRLHLRADNADMRLTEIGRRMGIVCDERWRQFTTIRRAFEEAKEILEGEKRSVAKWNTAIPSLNITLKPQVFSAMDLIGRHGSSIGSLSTVIPALSRFKGNEELERRLRIHAMYTTVAERMKNKMEEVRREASTRLPATIDYSSIKGLSMENIEKLEQFRPLSLAAATRIQGVTPEAIILLLRHAKRLQATV